MKDVAPHIHTRLRINILQGGYDLESKKRKVKATGCKGWWTVAVQLRLQSINQFNSNLAAREPDSK